jgi:hypothetical protein
MHLQTASHTPLHTLLHLLVQWQCLSVSRAIVLPVYSLNVNFPASRVFPLFFRYHLIRICEKSKIQTSGSCFTIFVIGFRSRSLPVGKPTLIPKTMIRLRIYLVVGSDTTIEDIYQHLRRLGLIPRSGPCHFYFTYRGRRASWDTTISSLGLGSLSHLQLRLLAPGGFHSMSSMLLLVTGFFSQIRRTRGHLDPLVVQIVPCDCTGPPQFGFGDCPEREEVQAQIWDEIEEESR